MNFSANLFILMTPNSGHKAQVGRYQLTEFIGEGPTGIVHKACIDGVGRVFALKQFHKTYISDPAIISAIATAARQYGALEHPRVAPLHGFAATDEYVIAATEFVEGISLDQILLDQDAAVGKRLPLGTSARLLVQLGRGIGYAHGRGLCHLGISPTNMVCNSDGELSITDFGFLAPGLVGKRSFDPPLGKRWAYVAPEQIEGKKTSPASDVYSIGCIAYELMVGHLPHQDIHGDALSKAILAGLIPGLSPGHGPNLDLPKPFLKVLKRALARSPFERFPDAAAMADGIEAAMRAVPVPGSLSEIGKIVSGRLGSEMRDEEATRIYDDKAEAIAEEFNDIATEDLDKLHLGDLRAQTTKTDGPLLPRAASESSGVPDMLLGPAGTGPTGTGQQFIGGENYGHPADDEEKTRVKNPVVDRAVSIGDDDKTEVKPLITKPLPKNLDDLANIEDDVSEVLQVPLNALVSVEVPHLPMSTSQPAVSPLLGEPREIPPPQRLDTLESSLPTPRTKRETAPANDAQRSAEKPATKRNIGMYAVVLAAVSAGTFFVYKHFADGSEPKTASKTVAPNVVSSDTITADAAPHIVSGTSPLDASISQLEDASRVVMADDAATSDTSHDAATAETTQDAGSTIISTNTSLLEIQSAPVGAKIYLDGTLAGKTPITLDASPDRHKLALLLPGYILHTADIDGSGRINITLSEVTPSEGPGGIKVRCRKKDRYYIYVDGNPTGQLCPSERIGVSKGRHVVEIYDPVTDSRREFKAVVKGTRASLRVRVD